MSVTIKQIAEQAGVSRGTVDRVLNNRPGVKEDIRKRVETIAKTLEYKPNPIAKALKSTQKQVLIGVVLGPDGEFTRQLRSGVQAVEDNYRKMGVAICCAHCEDTEEGGLQAIDTLVRAGADALAIRAVNSPAIAARINLLVENGIPVVTFNTDVSGCNRWCCVGQNYTLAGKVAAELMGKSLRKKGEILVVVEDGKLLVHSQRVSAFLTLIQAAYPAIHVQQILYTPIDPEGEYAAVRAYLEAHSEINGVYSSARSTGIIRAIRELQMTEQITLVCPDLIPSVIDSIAEDNCVDFLIGQQPEKQSAHSIQLLVDYLYYGIMPPTDQIYVDVDIRVKYTAQLRPSEGSLAGAIFQPS